MGFDQVLNFFAADSAGIVKLFLGFLILPFFFLYLKSQIHEKTSKAWELLDKSSLSTPDETVIKMTFSAIEEIEDKYVEKFNLELWLVLAGAMMIAGIFSIGAIVEHSGLLFPNNAHPVPQSQALTTQMKPNNSVKISGFASTSKLTDYQIVRGILNFYGVLIALGAAYYFYTTYVITIKKLGMVKKKYYTQIQQSND